MNLYYIQNIHYIYVYIQQHTTNLSIGIVDLMNHIGVCVVAGNVRRTAEIAFGDYEDPEYVGLKDYRENPDRAAFGWTSNNSVFASLGMDYAPVCERIVDNGEPGFAWLGNMQNYGRMNGIVDDRDKRAQGTSSFVRRLFLNICFG